MSAEPPRVDSSESIYPPREDTALLLPFAEASVPGRLLEIGCGSGTLSLAAARRGTRVVATDLNPYALKRLRQAAAGERLPLDLVRTDLARGLGRFDRILANPPYLPTNPQARDPDPWHNLAIDGGADGCAVTARILHALPEHLTNTGAAYVLVSSIQSAASLRALDDEWRALGGRRRTAATRALEGERLEVWLLELGTPRTVRP
ncbi:MAG: HemK2/MTQ2 family protein methyltransferase [Thermoplasmata archaeon]